MPIYEYICNDCGTEIEVLQKLSDPAPEICGSCGADGLKKKVSAAAFRLKGGGWYETDFKSGDKRNIAGDSGNSTSDSKSGDTEKKAASGADKASGDSKKKTETAASGKSDAKPAKSKPEPKSSK